MSFTATRLCILRLCSLLVVIPSSSAADASSIDAHVRTAQPMIARLIRQAKAESGSFRALVSRLDDSDVVVYVKFDGQISAPLDGRMTFVGAGGGRRYVVVSLAWGRPDLRTMSTLGHELQHAVEVAEHPEIVNNATLAEGYEEFGVQTRRVATLRSYETVAAIEAGHRVWTEICRRGE